MIDLTAIPAPAPPGANIARTGGAPVAKDGGFAGLLALGGGIIEAGIKLPGRQMLAVDGKGLPAEATDIALPGLVSLLAAELGGDPDASTDADQPAKQDPGEGLIDPLLAASSAIAPLPPPVQVPASALPPAAGNGAAAAPVAIGSLQTPGPRAASPSDRPSTSIPIASAGIGEPAAALAIVPDSPVAAAAQAPEIVSVQRPFANSGFKHTTNGPVAPAQGVATEPSAGMAELPVPSGAIGQGVKAAGAPMADLAPTVAPTTPDRAPPVAGPAAQVFARQLAGQPLSPLAVVSDPDPAEEIALIDNAGSIDTGMGAGLTTSAPTAPRHVNAAAQANLPVLDTRDADWMAQMIDQMDMVRTDGGGQSLRIRLSPDALGAIEISFDQPADGDVGVRIHAENPAARAMLNDAAPRLTEMAEARGLKLSHQQGEAAGQSGRDPQSFRQDQSSAGSTRAAPAGTEEAMTVDLRDETRIA